MAVGLSIMLCRAEKHVSRGGGPGQGQSPGHIPLVWAPLLLCSSPAATAAQHPQRCPRPQELLLPALPSGKGRCCQHGSAMTRRHSAWAAQGSKGWDILTSAWPPGVSVLLQRSQRRQGRCQSFPSEVTFSARAKTSPKGHDGRGVPLVGTSPLHTKP